MAEIDVASSNSSHRGADEFADLTRVTVFFAIVLAVAFAFTISYAAVFNRWTFGGVLLWTLALLTAGAALGFLFGIPKVLQRERAPAPPPSQPPGSPGASGDDSKGSPSLSYHQ